MKPICPDCGGTIHVAKCLLCEMFAACAVSTVSNSPKCWPMVSDALGVHVNQIEKANARNKRMGVNVVYNRKGQAVIPDRGERKRLLKIEGFHDNNGGYGD